MTQVNRLSFDMQLTKLNFNATSKYALLAADSRYSIATRVASVALTVIAAVAETLKNIFIAPVKAVVFAGQGVASLFKKQDAVADLKEAVENHKKEKAAEATKEAAVAEENEFVSNLTAFAKTEDCKKTNAQPRSAYKKAMRKGHYKFEQFARHPITSTVNGVSRAFSAVGTAFNALSSKLRRA